MREQMPNGYDLINLALNHGREKRNPAGNGVVQPYEAMIRQGQSGGADNGLAHGGQTKTRIKAHGCAVFAVGHAHGTLVQHMAVTGGHHYRTHYFMLRKGLVQHGIKPTCQCGVFTGSHCPAYQTAAHMIARPYVQARNKCRNKRQHKRHGTQPARKSAPAHQGFIHPVSPRLIRPAHLSSIEPFLSAYVNSIGPLAGA